MTIDGPDAEYDYYTFGLAVRALVLSVLLHDDGKTIDEARVVSNAGL
jgi:hypothetical protein